MGSEEAEEEVTKHRPLTATGLYDDDGRFRYRDPTVLECFFCAQVRLVYPIGAMSDKFKACKGCIRTRGASALRLGADEALAALTATTGENRYCRVCNRVVYLGGALICLSCVADLQRRHGKRVRPAIGRRAAVDKP